MERSPAGKTIGAPAKGTETGSGCLLGAPEQFRSGGDNAQRYSLNQRETLDAVLLDGRLELTNNLAERRREAVCDVAPELLVLRYGKRGNVQCFVFQHDRNSKGKQFGSIWISAVFASGAAQTGRKA